MFFCCLQIIEKKTGLLLKKRKKTSIKSTMQVSNCLDPYQAQHFVEPNLYDLQRLSMGKELSISEDIQARLAIDRSILTRPVVITGLNQ